MDARPIGICLNLDKKKHSHVVLYLASPYDPVSHPVTSVSWIPFSGGANNLVWTLSGDATPLSTSGVDIEGDGVLVYPVLLKLKGPGTALRSTGGDTPPTGTLQVSLQNSPPVTIQPVTYTDDGTDG
jgi:hypothetical protein